VFSSSEYITRTAKQRARSPSPLIELSFNSSSNNSTTPSINNSGSIMSNKLHLAIVLWKTCVTLLLNEATLSQFIEFLVPGKKTGSHTSVTYGAKHHQL
jgi:hypothetical protein